MVRFRKRVESLGSGAAAFVYLAACALPLWAQPGLSHVLPGAVSPGATTEVVIHGTKLDGPVQVWTSFPARVETDSGDPNQKDRTQLNCKVTLAPGVPAGIGGMVVATPDGMSDVLLVMIDDLPSVTEAGNNHSHESSQQVSLPVAIDGGCDGTVSDYFRFAAQAGEQVAIEVVATRLGWDFDPIIRVLDASGSELVWADDDLSTGADPRLVFTAPADGQYTVELRDNRYKPGGRYRLRLGDFPLVSTALPPAMSLGSAASLGFAGPRVAGVPTQNTVLLGGRSQADGAIDVKARSGQASGLATLWATPLPVVVETTDGPPAAASLPCVMAGRLAEIGERDLYSFTANKGQVVRFRAITRRLGSPAVVSLKVLSGGGSQLAESAVGDADEPVFDFTVPEDGGYSLIVEDLVGRGGDDFTYAVEARLGPQFTLTLKNDNNNRLRHSLPAGGAFALDVQCQRLAYDGPIRLSIDSPHDGWHVFNNIIPAAANEVKMFVVPPADMVPGELSPLRILGRPASTAGQFETEMSTIAQLRAARPQTPYPPAWLDGVICVSKLSPKPPFYRATADRQEVHFPRLVGQTQLTLKFERLDGNFKDVPLTVLPLSLPPGLSAEVKRSGNGPTETYEIIIKGPKDIAEGQHTLRYFAYAEMTGRGQGIYSGDISLNVVTPLAVSLVPAGALTVGDKQKVKATLIRRGDDKQPVTLKFKSLPPGVTAPEATTIAAEQNEADIELTAAADAAMMNFDQLIAIASSKYAGTDITVESPAVMLEVKAP